MKNEMKYQLVAGTLLLVDFIILSLRNPRYLSDYFEEPL
jgi:hypothetical protein